MTITDDYLTVDERNTGLDRARVHEPGRIEIPDKPPESSQDHRGEEEEEEKRRNSKLHRVRESLSEKKHDTAVKIKKTLHLNTHVNTSVDEELEKNASVLAEPVTEHSDSRLKEEPPPPDKVTAKDVFHDPINTAKKKFSGQGNSTLAANIATREVSHGQEVDLLRAHESLQNAKTPEEYEKTLETFGELLKERQNMYVRWTLDRHVTKVRILPKITFVKKSRKDFVKTDPAGNQAVDWRAYGQHLLDYSAHQYGGQYIGYGMDHPAPSKQTIMPNVERLIVASAPFQEFIMTTRRVYRWENPSETLKYLVIYTVLWYSNLVFPGMLSAIVFLVLQRYYQAPTIDDLRQDIERTEDRRQTALTLTEFIEKEGSHEWVDKILEAVGPWLMVQLADLANFFEVTRNFYEWRVPARTAASLLIMVVIILVSAFVPAQLIVRALTFIAGVTFFGLFPIATNFPEYRLLASMPKRLLWDIPTHAEWALNFVRAEGIRYQQTHAAPSSPTLDNDYCSYAAYWSNHRGRLVISQFSMRFMTDDYVHWRVPYVRLDRLEKINRLVEQKIPQLKSKDTGMDMKVVAIGVEGRQGAKEEWLLTDVDMRNEAFSQVLGFSGRPWQVTW